MGAQLAEMQSDILYGLSNSVGSPVDDVPLILTLEAIKIKSVEIMVRRFVELKTKVIDFCTEKVKNFHRNKIYKCTYLLL